MNKWTHPALSSAFIVIPLLASTCLGDARSNVIKLSCSQDMENNQTTFIENFVHTTEIIGTQIQTSHNATAAVGIPPNRNYGLVECYGDLSSQDCTLCYAEARNVFPRCFPNTGGRIYLDGCFMRTQNYSFYDEYTGPDDTFVCGNTTMKSRLFQDSVRQEVSNAVTAASRNSDYFAWEGIAVSVNESVYVLANCWSTLNSSSCRGCLEIASASISKCLPWSEGRALNSGCFLRYSDTNFLNPGLRVQPFETREMLNPHFHNTLLPSFAPLQSTFIRFHIRCCPKLNRPFNCKK